MTAVCDTINQLIKSGDLGVNSYADLNGKIADDLCYVLLESWWYDENIDVSTGEKMPNISFTTPKKMYLK